MIFSKASLPVWFRNLLDRSPTWPKSETHMILQLQAKVHGLGYLGVWTCTYLIFSEFKAIFRIIPSFLPHDKHARGVVVGCVYSVICLLCFAGLASVVWLAWFSWLAFFVWLLASRLVAMRISLLVLLGLLIGWLIFRGLASWLGLLYLLALLVGLLALLG